MPGVPLEILRARILEAAQQSTAIQGVGRKEPKHIIADVQRHFEALESLLQSATWLVCESISLADIAVASQVRALTYASEVEEMLLRMPRVNAWRTRVDDAAPCKAPP
jgi:glutathione S-transferase